MAYDVIDLLEQGYAWTAGRIAQVRPDDLDTPTPCEGWQLRHLLDHLVGSLERLAAAAEGEGGDGDRDGAAPADPPDGRTQADSASQAAGPGQARAQTLTDRLGDDCGHAAFDAVRRRALAAWRRPGVMARTCELPLGTLPAPAAAHINLVEVVVHGWDVSQAIGEAAAIPPGLAEPMLEFSRKAVDPARGRAFGPDLAVGDTVGDRLVAFLGRKP
jgi:uncharacterized protein (TIGR03086 family)